MIFRSSCRPRKSTYPTGPPMTTGKPCLKDREVLSWDRLCGVPRPHRGGPFQKQLNLVLGFPRFHRHSSRGFIQWSGCPNTPHESYLHPRSQETQPLPGLLGPLLHQVQFHSIHIKGKALSCLVPEDETPPAPDTSLTLIIEVFMCGLKTVVRTAQSTHSRPPGCHICHLVPRCFIYQ